MNEGFVKPTVLIHSDFTEPTLLKMIFVKGKPDTATKAKNFL